MMRCSALVAWAIFMYSVVCGGQEANAPTEPKRVKGAGISISAPAGWTVDTSGKTGVPLALKHPSFAENGINITALSVETGSAMNNDQVRQMIADLAAKRGLTVVRDEIRSVGAFENGYIAILENAVSGDRLTQAVHVLQRDGRFIVLTCTARSDQYAQHADSLRAIIETVRPESS